MKTFEEMYNDLKGQMEALLTADNTDTVTNLVKGLDNIKERYNAQEEEMKGLKDKMVDLVRNTTFAKEPESIETQEPKSIDDLLVEGVNKIIKNRKRDD